MVLAFLLSAAVLSSPATEPSPGENAAAPAPRLRVLVRIDPGGASKGFRIPDVVDQIREIWRPYIDIEFAAGEASSASLGAAPGLSHDLPGYDDELRLLITDRLRAQGSADEATLGWIQFVAGRPEATITVSVAAARALMSRGSWLGRPIDELPLRFQRQFVTHALGRGAAHEIGHYLLRSPTHAPYGLMRQRMTVPDIMDQGLALFRLRTSEASMLERRALRAPASASMSAEDERAPEGTGS
jgi:hypothetical protein